MEAAFQEMAGEESDVRVKLATLFSDPTSPHNEIYLMLGCVGSLPVAYLIPYTSAVPVWVDLYTLGVWDADTREWLAGQHYKYENPLVTDEGASIYIYNTIQIQQLVGLLHSARQNQNSSVGLFAGMVLQADEKNFSLWGKYDVSGLEDALGYLTCFEGVR